LAMDSRSGGLNKIELVPIAERVVVSYFAVFLHDKSGIKINVLRHWRKFRKTFLRLNSYLCPPERRDKHILKIAVGRAHFSDSF